MANHEYFGQLLLKAKLIDALQLRSVLARRDQWGGRIPQLVVEMGLASEDSVVQALSQALHFPVASLENVAVNPAVLHKVEASFAEKTAVFPLELKDKGKVLVLSMADPTDLETIDTVSRKARVRVEPRLAGETAILRAIALHYRNERRTLSQQDLAAMSFPGERELSAEELGDLGQQAVFQPAFEPQPLSKETFETGAFLSQALIDSQSMLADILNGATESVFSPEQEARILALSENQKKAARLQRAIVQLLADKGVR